MIGKIIGAYAGSKLAQNTRGGVDSTGGALIGLAAATIARRLSLPAMIALGAGGYVMKKFLDNGTASKSTQTTTPASPTPTV